MATLTGNTAGSLKKMWPPVKRKAIDAHLSFAKFLGSEGGNAAAVPKATGGRKRKATADVDGEDVDSKSAEDKSDSANKSDGKAKTKKKAPAAKPKGRPAKKTKKEVKEEEDSADGGDGMGEYTLKQSIVKWLNSTDGSPDAEEDVEGED
jgi:hypothetical protein